ncbi:MAG: cupin domain-containing protein [Saprospiraceae bacterium]|nr:cupin domain-containing protein [Saprospiraceae bacterium]
MTYKYPHTIENCVGEKITFTSVVREHGVEKVWLNAYCAPGAGPAMHTHFRQDESLTVISGRMAYQTMGSSVQYAMEGESVVFKRGVPHKFWADGDQPLECSGWIYPANSVVFFLTAVYAAQNKSGKGQPEPFDSAYLLTMYSSEYDMPEIPVFVKKIIFPITRFIGKLRGKYKHFKDAPQALR